MKQDYLQALDVDSQKEILSLEQDKYTREMEEELGKMVQKAKKVGTTALVVGGLCVVAFIVGKKIFSKNKKARFVNVVDPNSTTQMMVQQPREESPIIRMVKEQMTMFLIAIVKEKLVAFIQAQEFKASDKR